MAGGAGVVPARTRRFPLREQAVAETLTCEQSFRPFAEALERNGWNVREESEIEADSTRYALVLVLPPRQREEARALFARAVALTAPGGRVVACQSNNEGARSGEADLRQLTGLAGSLTKHHCRTYWTAPLPADTDATLQARWAALDAPRKILDGRFVSRPGVFAWDRIDPASALLVEHLPTTLAGHGADLGAGFGYLSAEVLARCPKVTVLDLYEAQTRALTLARRNLQASRIRRSCTTTGAMSPPGWWRTTISSSAIRLSIHPRVPTARISANASSRWLHRRCARAGNCCWWPTGICPTNRCSTKVSGRCAWLQSAMVSS